MQRFSLSIAAILLLVTASSCSTAESRAAYEAQRRARLLEIYPVRTTTRADVKKRFDREPQSVVERLKSGRAVGLCRKGVMATERGLSSPRFG